MFKAAYIKRYTANIIRHYKVLKGKEFRNFAAARAHAKFVLIDTPIHGNLGDQAIVLAERQFLAEYLLPNDIYEITQREYLLCEEEIITAMNKDDIIFIHGGGFIGTLWQNEENVLLRILDRLKNHTIIVFPQTVYFEQSEQGKAEVEKFVRAQQRCRDLTIFTREKQSHDYLKKIGMDEENCICVPDIVTYLKYDRRYDRKDMVLLCLRRDKEKTFDERNLERIIEMLHERNFETQYTDTVIEREICKTERRAAVHEKLDEFAQARLVITDRLHGMLFAAVTETPCIAVDNVSRKVSGVYEWIKELDYIKCVSQEQLNPALADRMLGCEDCRYTNKHLEEYYKLMGQYIQSRRGNRNS